MPAASKVARQANQLLNLIGKVPGTGESITVGLLLSHKPHNYTGLTLSLFHSSILNFGKNAKPMKQNQGI